MYTLALRPTNKPTIIDRKDIKRELSMSCNVTQVRVFCHEYHKAYVGDASSSINSESLAIQNWSKNLCQVRMQYRDNTTGKMMTLSPDRVHQRMVEFVLLLPESAIMWKFCLPWIYFEALLPSIRDDLRAQEYTLPAPTHLTTKPAQIQATTSCRDEARKAYKRMKGLHRHFETFLSPNSPTKRSTNMTFESDTVEQRFYEDELSESDSTLNHDQV